MFYADYKTYDMLNGEGIRHSLYVSGCTHKCYGCFNEKAWSFHYGRFFDGAVASQIIQDLKDPVVQGLSVLGGEPFQNSELLLFLKTVKKTLPDKDIWVWTGYTFEELVKLWKWKRQMLNYVDVLVDGRFNLDQKDLTLQFRGSKNQRIIDVKRSLEKGEVVLWTNTENRTKGI